MERRGTVFIAPVAFYLPSDRMVDPELSRFSVHWEDWDADTQRGEMLADGGDIEGAGAAIAWGCARCDRVVIRLGHSDESQFSAGRIRLAQGRHESERQLPLWPPSGPPAEGWWTPSDEAAAEEETYERARRGAAKAERVRPDPDLPDGPWTGHV